MDCSLWRQGAWTAAAVGALGWAFAARAGSGLPTIAPPTKGNLTEGDYIGTFQAYAADVILLVALVICVVAFLVVAKNIITKYSQISEQRATWGDLGLHAGLGVLLLAGVIFLATQATQVLS